MYRLALAFSFSIFDIVSPYIFTTPFKERKVENITAAPCHDTNPCAVNKQKHFQ